MDACGACPTELRRMGMSTAIGNFLTVCGSHFFHPSRVCDSRGRNLSDPGSFVGFSPQAKAIVKPTAVRALLTVLTLTWRPLPYQPAQTCAANPERHRTLTCFLKVWVHSQRLDIGDPMVPVYFPFLGSRRHSSIAESFVCKMEISFVAISEERWKTVQEP